MEGLIKIKKTSVRIAGVSAERLQKTKRERYRKTKPFAASKAIEEFKVARNLNPFVRV
jgi:hypothetical protein